MILILDIGFCATRLCFGATQRLLSFIATTEDCFCSSTFIVEGPCPLINFDSLLFFVLPTLREYLRLLGLTNSDTKTNVLDKIHNIRENPTSKEKGEYIGRIDNKAKVDFSPVHDLAKNKCGSVCNTQNSPTNFYSYH